MSSEKGAISEMKKDLFIGLQELNYQMELNMEEFDDLFISLITPTQLRSQLIEWLLDQ